jgi:hypothetical protein
MRPWNVVDVGWKTEGTFSYAVLNKNEIFEKSSSSAAYHLSHQIKLKFYRRVVIGWENYIRCLLSFLIFQFHKRTRSSGKLKGNDKYVSSLPFILLITFSHFSTYTQWYFTSADLLFFFLYFHKDFHLHLMCSNSKMKSNGTLILHLNIFILSLSLFFCFFYQNIHQI